MSAPKTTRVRQAVWWLAGAVVLAAVVFGASALQPTGRSGGNGDSSPGTYLADKAVSAWESGDTTAALGFAERALAVDPGNVAAKKVAEDVATVRSASSGGSSTPSAVSTPAAGGNDGGVAPDTTFLAELTNPSDLLPGSFPGYALGSIANLEGDVTVAGTIQSSAGAASSIVWTIHDGLSAEAATAFVTKTSKALYAKNATSLQVDGATAYFGTDGTRYASVVYVRGRYVFEVLVSGRDGAPAGYRSSAIAASRAFADTPAK